MVHKYFQCFRCKYHNHFNNIPNYVKGKCCRRCHTFNYFNYHPRKNNNNHNNYKNKNINNLTARTNKQNYTLPRNTNNTMNSNFIRNENSNGILLNQIGTSLFNYNQEDSFTFDNNSFFSNSGEEDEFGFSNTTDSNSRYNNFDLTGIRLYNNSIFNNNDRLSNINQFGSNYLYNNNFDRPLNNNILNIINSDNENENNNILYSYNYKKISWLNKEKFTEDKIKKYGNNEQCSICLENFKLNNEIYITKCNHIFHYKCIEEALNKDISDCPNCRSNLKTGEKKRVVNVNNNINYLNNYNNYQRYNNFTNIIERNNEYDYNRNRNNDSNNRNSNSEELNVFYVILAFIIFILVIFSSA